jgi:hypothetical protein
MSRKSYHLAARYLLGCLIAMITLLSCTSNENNSVTKSKEKAIIKWKAMSDILNNVLCELVPNNATATNNGERQTIYFHEPQVQIDSSLTLEMISLGASKKLFWMCYPKERLGGGLRGQRIENCEQFDVIHIPPMTTKECDNNLGALLISAFIFSDDKKEALFIYEFEQSGRRNLGTIGYLEVKCVKGKWNVKKKIEIKKGKHRLIS